MSSYEKMNQILKQQKEFFIKNGAPSVELRIDRLQRLKTLIMDNRYDFIDALNSDFGNRSKNASMLSDVYRILIFQVNQKIYQDSQVLQLHEFVYALANYRPNMIYQT